MSPEESSVGLLIDGQERPAEDGSVVPAIDPSTGEQHGVVADGSPADVDAAVASARAAFNAWWNQPPVERGRILMRVAELIRARADELWRIDALDAGIPTRMARTDVENAARYFEYYSGAADKLHGDSIPLGPTAIDFTIREPYGVCAVIVPFNVPFQLTARSVAPALATGNTVVVKPAEQAPVPVLELGRLMIEAGVPPGVVNVVPGPGATVGSHLAGHPDVDHVTFTGSLVTGQRVMEAATTQLTPVTLELGGKSPQVIFADADIDDVIQAIRGSSLLTAGQVCSAGTRVLVEASAYDALVEPLVGVARTIQIGRATDGPDMGPLVSATQQQRVLEAIDRASAEGEILTGGRAPEDPSLASGFFVEPTLIGDLGSDPTVTKEEIFGPVLTIQPFETTDNAIEMANDTEFGLVAGIWTRDVGRAMEAARQIRAGQIFVNNYGVGGGTEMPFGGFKKSGIGREKGLPALLEYTQVKNVCVAVGE